MQVLPEEQSHSEKAADAGALAEPTLVPAADDVLLDLKKDASPAPANALDSQEAGLLKQPEPDSQLSNAADEIPIDVLVQVGGTSTPVYTDAMLSWKPDFPWISWQGLLLPRQKVSTGVPVAGNNSTKSADRCCRPRALPIFTSVIECDTRESL